MKVTLNRENKYFYFIAENESNLLLNIDGSSSIGGENKGFSPMELMLSGMASCSTIDLLLILKKQKQIVDNIKIVATAERTDTKSKAFKSVNLHYILDGVISSLKLQKAIDLALTKYCSAILSLNPDVIITSSYHINKVED